MSVKVKNLMELSNQLLKLTTVKAGILLKDIAFCYIYNLKTFSIKRGELVINLKDNSCHIIDISDLNVTATAILEDGMIKGELLTMAKDWDK